MTLLEEERLGELRDLAPLAPPRPVAQVHDRCRQLRRARRIWRVVGGAALAAVLVATPAVLGSLLSHGGAPVGGVNASGAECRGYAEAVHRADLPALRYLAPGDALGRPLRETWGRRDRQTCLEDVPAAVLLDLAGGGTTTRRSLAVWGPEAKISGMPERSVPIRRGNGVLFTEMEGARVLSARWTEPDGSRWGVTSSGLDRRELLAVIDHLRIADLHLLPASLPRGYGEVLFPRPVTTGETYGWTAFYGPAADEVVVGVGWPTGTPVEALSTREPAGRVRFVDINGVRAAYWAADGVGSLDWRTAAGLTFSLTGPADPAGLAALARRLEQVAADDPRLTGIPES